MEANCNALILEPDVELFEYRVMSLYAAITGQGMKIVPLLFSADKNTVCSMKSQSDPDEKVVAFVPISIFTHADSETTIIRDYI